MTRRAWLSRLLALLAAGPLARLVPRQHMDFPLSLGGPARFGDGGVLHGVEWSESMPEVASDGFAAWPRDAREFEAAVTQLTDADIPLRRIVLRRRR